MAEPFVGEIRMFTCDYAPRDWAFCDGTLLAIAQHTILFSVISNYYGGDGRTTMALPNLQGRSPMNPRKGPGLTYRTLAETAGLPSIQLSQQNLPQHAHQARAVMDDETSNKPTGLYLSKMKNNRLYKKEATNPAPMSSETIQNTGQGQPHVNMQPYTVVNFCIALDGTYPSRS